MTHSEIASLLHQNADPIYNQFNSRIAATPQPTIGVRIPILRNLAKEILRDKPLDFIHTYPVRHHEELLVKGFVIAQLKTDLDTWLNYVDAFVPTIDCWAVCDCFCSTLKRTKKAQAEFWPLIVNYLHSEREFEVRFAVVMMMCYYLDDAHIDRTLDCWSGIHSDYYYVNMGVGWGLATAFAKQRNKTLAAMLQPNLSPDILKKTVQKCRESFRISAEDKELLKNLFRTNQHGK